MCMSKLEGTKSEPAKAFASDAAYQVFARGAPVKSLNRSPPPEYPNILLDEPKSAQQALIVIGTDD